MAVAAPAERVLADFRHVRWEMAEGAPSRINAITQSSDGDLWIGGVEGLVRFDGVGFERVAADDPALRRMVVSMLAAGRNGTIWVGLARGGGVLRWRDGRLTDARMPNPSREVNDLALDRDGALWVARGGRTSGQLAHYAAGQWREFGLADGLPEQQAWQVLPTRDGAVWLVLSDRVMVRRRGGARFEATAIRTTPRGHLAEDARGRLWLSDMSGVRRVAGPGGGVGAYARPASVGGVRSIVDGSGSLWGATWNGGLFRIATPGADAPVEAYRAIDGLTSDQARVVFQDREGTIWVGTELGLDLFRPASVVVERGIPANSPTSYRMAAAADGAVYVADATAVYEIPPGQPPRLAARTPSPAEALCAARDGGVWAVLGDRILRVGRGAVARRAKPAGTTAYGCAEDAAGRLWLPSLERGLYVFEGGAWRAGPQTATGLPANAALDPSGMAAIAFRQPPPAPSDPRFVPIFRERFDVGSIEGVFAGRDALFVGGADGLVRLRGGEARSLPARRRPWLASVNGLAQTPDGDTWTIGDAGIVRVRTDALERAFAGAAALPYRLFDFRDGLNSFAQKAPGAQAAVGGDGRVWFLTRRNVVRIDPARLPVNTVPPPVRIRAVSAEGRRYDSPRELELPAGTTNLTVSYTAPSLAEPSRVRFRYRLEGVDRGWVEAGPRRNALYVNLGPGRYRFRAIAMNNDGVWNTQGAAVDMRIPPTLLQTWWFRVFLALVAGGLLWLAVRWRVRAATAAAEARLYERQAERLRIARELHDTLLQGFHGLLMRFQVVADRIPADQPARNMMETELDRAEAILVEGRDRVRGLREEQDAGSPLIVELERLAYELERDNGASVDVRESGPAEPLNVDAHREIFAIAREALLNAARHAQATTIVCELIFSRRRLVLECRDDGVGIPAAVLREGGRDGHWGLRGMVERARQIGGDLRIHSQPSGTTIRLSVPMRLARPRRRPRWLQRPLRPPSAP